MPTPTDQLGYVPNHTIVRIGINVKDWHSDVLGALGLEYAGLTCKVQNPESGADSECPPAPGQPTLPGAPHAVAVSSPTQRCEFLWRAVRPGAGPALAFNLKFNAVNSSGQSQILMAGGKQLMVGSGSNPPSGWEFVPGAGA